ncbi:putative lipase [Trypanosoma cruzi]|uniref:Putative lipase n=1 Tax=Trypanosoma cruzi TaxID=5693 RepID=A0A2V2WW27_TRYCR|nr:putative lipase [Trypanosoma cruzi]
MEAVGENKTHVLAESLLAHEISPDAWQQAVRPEANSPAGQEEVSGGDGNQILFSAALASKKPPGRLVAELQIETLSTTCGRIFLYSWYFMLLFALFLQSMVSLQWEMTNICGATQESLYKLDKWSSPCVQSRAQRSDAINWSEFAVGGNLHDVPVDILQGSTIGEEEITGSVRNVTIIPNDFGFRRQRTLRWVGDGQGMLLDLKLNRFVRVILSMASPRDQLPEGVNWEKYPLMIALEESLLPSDDNESSSSDMQPKKSVFFYNTSTICYRSIPRCSSVVLPQTVAVATNESRITLTIFGVDEALANVSAASAVGIFFQRAEYTMGTIVCRYVFLFFSILHLIRFIYRKRYSRTLYEQHWVMFLHLALYLYLDPVFVAGIYETQGASVYHFFEFHVPTYFAALLSCFIYALITASMSWTISSEERARYRSLSESEALRETVGPCAVFASSPTLGTAGLAVGMPPVLTSSLQEEEERCPSPREISRRASFSGLNEIRPIEVVDGAIPLWAKFSMANYLLAVFLLDLAQSYVGGWDWGTDMTCVSFSCLYIRYTLYSLMLIFIIVCCVLLVQLHRSLGRRPYLETRPQQLACRVFIFVFTTALIYFVVQVILIAFLYPQIIGIVAYQPFTQLSPVIVSTFFVNHITFVYTTTVASRRVPIRPENPHWRRVVWSSEWYRWLNLHGGILYIFHNERQERYFNWVQNKGKNSSEPCCEANGTAVKKKRSTREEVGEEANAGAAVLGSEGRTCEQRAAVAENKDGDFSSESSDTGASDNDRDYVDSQTERPHPLRTPRTRGGVVEFLEKAERHLIDRPAILIDHLEGVLVDPLQSLFLRRRGRMPFFNLETAIDCLNLSWEAYVATERQGETEGVADVVEFVDEPGAGLSQRSRHCGDSCCPLLGGGDAGIRNNSDCDNDDGELHLDNGEHCDNHDIRDSVKGDSKRAESFAVFTGETPSPNSRMSTEQYGYKQLAVVEVREVQVVITVMDTTLPCHHHKHPRLVIAFRGTDNLSNAREDLRFRRRVWREVDPLRQWGIRQSAKVHTGFLRMWISLKETVLRTVKSYLSANPTEVYSIFCTGHSLGGALASLCAYSLRRMLRLMNYPLLEVTVYTFGQPALGNRAFQKAYDKAVPRTFRVVNESDAVSLFTVLGGCHVGIEVDIDRHGNYICKPMFIERWFRPTQGRGFAVANHTLFSYAQSLNAVAMRNSGGSCKVRCLEPYVCAKGAVPDDTEPHLATPSPPSSSPA